MTKLKKSVKVLIISGVSVLCVLAIVLGCVFGLRKPKDGPTNGVNPPSQNTPIVPEPVTVGLTAAQVGLMNAINEKQSENEYNISLPITDTTFIGENGVIDYDSIIEIHENYIVCRNNDVLSILIKTENSGDIVYKDVLQFLNIEGDVKYFSHNVSSKYNSFVSVKIIYQRTSDSKYVASTMILNLTNEGVVEIIKSIDVESSSEILKTDVSKFTAIEFYKNSFLCVYDSLKNSEYTNFELYDYNKSLIFKLEDVNHLHVAKNILNNSFSFEYDSKVYFGNFENGNIKTYQFNERTDIDNIYSYTLTENYLFVEEATLAIEKTILTVDDKNYSYKLINLKTGKENNIKLEDKYAKAKFGEVNSCYYYLFEQKANEDNSDVLDVGIMIYLDANSSKIFKYEASSIENNILWLDNLNILSSYGFYKTTNSISADLNKKFDESNKLVSSKINSNSFILSENSIKKIYNNELKSIFDNNIVEYFSYDEGYYIVFDGESFYSFNAKSKETKKIENFYKDNEYSNHTAIINGAGYYLTENIDETFSLYNYKNVLIFDNIKTPIYKNKGLSTYLNLTLSNDKLVSVYLNGAVVPETSTSGEISTGSHNIADNYYMQSQDFTGTDWVANGSTDNLESVMLITAYKGKYPSSGTIELTGNSSIKYETTISFNWTYSLATNVISITSTGTYQYISISYKNTFCNWLYDSSGNIGEFSLFIGIVDTYWGGDSGIPTSMDVLTDDLWITVTNKVMSTDKKYTDAHIQSNYQEDKTSVVTFGNSFGVSSNYEVGDNVIGGKIKGYSDFVFKSAAYVNFYSSHTPGLTLSVDYFYRGTTADLREYYTYACYTPWIFSISVVANGGVFAEEPPTTGKAFSDFNIKDPTKTGYESIGITANLMNVYYLSDGDYIIDDSYDDGKYIFNLCPAYDGATIQFVAAFEPITYKVEYVLNGGENGSNAPGELIYDTPYEIDHPTKTGYIFAGWKITGMDLTTHEWGGTTNTLTESYNVYETSGFKNLTSVKNSTVTFEASWTVINYTIKYELNGGRASAGNTYVTTVEYGRYFYVSDPVKTGYSFNKWVITGMNDCRHSFSENQSNPYQSNNTTEEISSENNYFYMANLTSVSSVVTLTAYWTPNTYDIQVNTNNASTNSPIEYADSYLFGINSVDEGEFNVDKLNSNPVYAGYYAYNEGYVKCVTLFTVSESETDSTLLKIYNSSSGIYEYSPVKSIIIDDKILYYGYINLENTSITEVYTNSAYKIWNIQTTSEPTEEIIRMIYPFDNSYKIENINYDETKEIEIPTKVGYKFAGWSISGMETVNSLTGETIKHYYGNSADSLTEFDGEIISGINAAYLKNLRSTYGTVTLTAIWTPISYNIEYDADGGVFDSGVNNSTSATYDTKVYVTSPIRHGYNFAGWYIIDNSIDDDNNTINYYLSNLANYPDSITETLMNLSIVDGSTIKLKAIWESVDYTININYNDESKVNTNFTDSFDSIVTINNPTKSGYEFNYWSISGMTNCEHSKNCACYNLSDNGECSHYHSIDNSTINSGRFSGIEISGITSTKFLNLACIEGTIVTFNANWTAKTYNIINKAAAYGSTSVSTIEFGQCFEITSPTTSPLGYHFGGWKIIGANNKDSVTNQMVNHYYGSDYNDMSYWTGSDDYFAYITDGSSKYYFKNLTSEDGASVTLEPIWVPNVYYVEFDLNNPNDIDNDLDNNFNSFRNNDGSKKVLSWNFDQDYSVLQPTKEGYTFKGWSISGLTDNCDHYVNFTLFKSRNGKYIDDINPNIFILVDYVDGWKNLRSDHMASENVKLTANWEANEYTITYHFLPYNFDVTQYSSNQIDTHVNISSNMTGTLTQTVKYDSEYKSLAYKEDNGKINFEMPVGLKHIQWVVFNDELESDDESMIQKQNFYVFPNVNAYYSFPYDTHYYAYYVLAEIKLRYYTPKTDANKNFIQEYKNYEEYIVKFTDEFNFLNSTGVDDFDFVGWMISADFFGGGNLTPESLTAYDYNGTSYIAYRGTKALWGFTNVDAYDYDDPRYYLYAIYSDEYSGDFEKLSFEWNSTSDSYHVSSSIVDNSELTGSIRIPAYYFGSNGWGTVTHIKDNAFKEKLITELIMPNTIISIGKYAFSSCEKISSIVLSNTLETIDSYAFASMENLTGIIIPSSVKTINSFAFNNTKLESIEINEGLEYIGNSAFKRGDFGPKFTNVMLPDTLISMESKVFHGCSSLESINIPQGILGINSLTFYGCTSLEEVNFDTNSSLLVIGQSAFYNCSSLTNMDNIPNSVVTIGHSAFYACYNLTSINLSSNLTFLGRYAFAYCAKLSSINLPYGLTEISSYTFLFCVSLASVKIPETVTKIGESAFNNCQALTEIVIPKSVQTIDSNVFTVCLSLSSMTIPFIGESRTSSSAAFMGYFFGASSVENNADGSPNISHITVTDAPMIYPKAFYNFSKIETITIYDETIRIGSNVFENCSSLQELIISKNATSIGEDILVGCTALEALEIPFIGSDKTTSENGYLGYWYGKSKDTRIDSYLVSNEPTYYGLSGIAITNATAIHDYALYGASDLESVWFNDEIISIGDYAFYGLGLEMLTLPKSLTSIGSYAFAGSLNLNIQDSFNIGLEEIGNYAFNGCNLSNLKTIPSSVRTIGDYAFSATKIQSLIIMDGVTSIGQGAFSGCGSSLESVVLPNTITEVSNSMFGGGASLTYVYIPDSVLSIGFDAFFGCSALNSIDLPSSLQSIGDSVFYGTALTEINIPNSVVSIGMSAFESCTSLTKVQLSYSLESIGAGCFYGCTALSNINFESNLETFATIDGYNKGIFEGCTSLKRVDLSKTKVTTLPVRAFLNCTALTDFIFPKTITEVKNTFIGCSVLKYLYFCNSQGTNPTFYDRDMEVIATNSVERYYNYDKLKFTFLGEDFGYSVDDTSDEENAAEKLIEGQLIIPSTFDDGVNGRHSVTIIEDYAFFMQTNITSVTIPRTITEIGDHAFNNANLLTSVIIENAYNETSKLKSMGENAFYNTSITSFTIPYNVEVLEKCIFDYCSNLSNIIFLQNAKLEIIEGNVFGETNISGTFIIPDSVKVIESKAFATMRKVTTIKLPSGLNHIENNVFSDCDSLKTIYISSNIKNISAHSPESSPFWGCSTDLNIFCETRGKLSGWGPYWNYILATQKALTHYNYDEVPRVAIDNDDTYPFTQLEDGTLKSGSNGNNEVTSILKITNKNNPYINVRFEFWLESEDCSFSILHNGMTIGNVYNGATAIDQFNLVLAYGDVLELKFQKTSSIASHTASTVFIRNLTFDKIINDCSPFDWKLVQYSGNGLKNEFVSEDIPEDAYNGRTMLFGVKITAGKGGILKSYFKFMTNKNTDYFEFKINNVVKYTKYRSETENNKEISIYDSSFKYINPGDVLEFIYYKDTNDSSNMNKIFIKFDITLTEDEGNGKFDEDITISDSGQITTTLKCSSSVLESTTGSERAEYGFRVAYDCVIYFEYEMKNIYYNDNLAILRSKSNTSSVSSNIQYLGTTTNGREKHMFHLNAGNWFTICFKHGSKRVLNEDALTIYNLKIEPAFLFKEDDSTSNSSDYINDNSKISNSTSYYIINGNSSNTTKYKFTIELEFMFEKNSDILIISKNDGSVIYSSYGINLEEIYIITLDVILTKNECLIIQFIKDDSIDYNEDYVRINKITKNKVS